MLVHFVASSGVVVAMLIACFVTVLALEATNGHAAGGLSGGDGPRGSLAAARGVIAPHYPTAGNGRRPYPLGVMLRIHFMQHWYGYSDPAMEDALHDIPALRRLAGLDAGESRMPDETTILHFRHLLEAHELAQSLFQEVVALLTEQGLILREGTIVDVTLIAAPPSAKNAERQRDPEMTSSKKGNQWHFGMKAHIGADTPLANLYMARKLISPRSIVRGSPAW